MSPRAKIDPDQGKIAVKTWAEHPAGSVPRAIVATAVRYTTGLLAERSPGGAVELRVPPFAVVQAVAGVRHTRGTPPAVVETDADTWLALAIGRMRWEDARQSGALHASGERSDLRGLLPVITGFSAHAACCADTQEDRRAGSDATAPADH
ncbi:sterol carrier family protein [Devriesea agamarum]|uniref:sterol carrier family protein n=1 Tax=Devriesea agamarum TaxID=472569 RepID=UPI0008371FE4|nr:sterol carrier family protein [Devriesea agamarum]